MRSGVHKRVDDEEQMSVDERINERMQKKW